MLIDYFNFVKGLIDSTIGHANVINKLKKVLWAKETMEGYKKYLDTKLIKLKVKNEDKNEYESDCKLESKDNDIDNEEDEDLYGDGVEGCFVPVKK